MHKTTTTKQKYVSKQTTTSAKTCNCAQEMKCAKCVQSHQKLSQPRINSSMRHICCMEQLSKFKSKEAPESISSQLPPSKITQKLNFGANRTVFKNLTPINVNDSLLLPKEKISIPKKYVPSKEKVPEPDLRDFLEPVEPATYTIPEPELKMVYCEYEFDVLSYCRSFIDL